MEFPVWTNGSPRSFFFSLSINFKAVVFENKFCHSGKAISRNNFYLLDYQALFIRPSDQHHELCCNTDQQRCYHNSMGWNMINIF